MHSELTNSQFAWSVPVSRAEVYWYVSDTRVANAQEISDGIGLSKSTVQGHLTALNKAGAVTGEGRPKRYSICEGVSVTYLNELKDLEYIARFTSALRCCSSPVPESGITQKCCVLLFQCVESAQEAAYMLKGTWDTCNAVTLNSLDVTAVELIAEMLEVEFCQELSSCILPYPITLQEISHSFAKSIFLNCMKLSYLQ